MKKLFPYALSIAVLLSCDVFSQANQVVISLSKTFSANNVLGNEFEVAGGYIYEGPKKVGIVSAGKDGGTIYNIDTKGGYTLSIAVSPTTYGTKVKETIINPQGKNLRSFENRYGSDGNVFMSKVEGYNSLGVKIFSAEDNFDSLGNLSSIINTTEENGLPTNSNSFYYITNNGETVLTEKTKSSYSENGKLAEVTAYDPNGTLISVTRYDAAGNARISTIGGGVINQPASNAAAPTGGHTGVQHLQTGKDVAGNGKTLTVGKSEIVPPSGAAAPTGDYTGGQLLQAGEDQTSDSGPAARGFSSRM